MRGEPFSAIESDSGREEEEIGKGRGFALPELGDSTGMLETRDRKLLNDGMLIFAREGCFLAYAEVEDVGTKAAVRGIAAPLLSDEVAEWVCE